MSTDEYVPREEQVRDEWISAMTTEDPDNYWDAITDEEAHARWSAFLARVRRDAYDWGRYDERMSLAYAPPESDDGPTNYPEETP